MDKLAPVLALAIKDKASDVHLLVGAKPFLRVNGQLFVFPGGTPLEKSDSIAMAKAILGEERYQTLLKRREMDCSYVFQDQARFRVNLYFQRESLAIAMRLIPPEVPRLADLNLPPILRKLTEKRQGFVLVTGPTGHGKSTTLAAMLAEINATRAEHIVTIEDPIEYFFRDDKSVFSQREIGSDTLSWANALRSTLREDPNVVLIGEMRDLETIKAALTVAETGHLVFSTLHTNSAAETIDRIVDVFPPGAKAQVRMQLANSLLAVISQRLIPTIKPGRVPAIELLLNNHAVQTAIREDKTHMIDNIIQTSAEVGMRLLETSLASWVNKRVVSLEVAKEYALRPKELMRDLQQQRQPVTGI